MRESRWFGEISRLPINSQAASAAHDPSSSYSASSNRSASAMLIPTAEGIVKKTRPVGQRIAKPTSYLYTPPPPPDSRSMSILHDDTYPVSSYRAPSSSSYTPQKPYGEWEQQAAVPSESEDLEVEAAPILIAAPSLASDATIDEAFVLKERSMDSSHFPGTLPPPCAPVQFKKRQVSNTPKNRSIRVKLE